MWAKRQKNEKLRTIQAINREDIPDEFIEELANDGNSLISITDDGSPFSAWLKSQGFIFNKPEISAAKKKKLKVENWGWLAIWW